MVCVPDILATILQEKEKEIARRKKRGLFYRPFWDSPRRSLKEALSKPGFNIIAEVKRASPSRGLITKDFDLVKIAKAYEDGGAAAISCLTDEKFFAGHLEHLAAIREVVSLPLLRKDFIIDTIQIEEARAYGADAVLLIVAALSPSKLKELLKETQKHGLEALVEVHNAQELEIALEAGAEIIGVNNRNLKTFEVKIETSLTLKKLTPSEIPFVAESGIKNSEDLKLLSKAGIHAALIGECLMRADDHKTALHELLSALS